MDICIGDFYSKTTPPVGLIDDELTQEDFILLRHLASILKKTLVHEDTVTFSQAGFPFVKVNDLYSGIPYRIVIGNLLDIERTNLIIEYLNLDKRVKPFLFALKEFIKQKKINDEKKGYPNSHVFIMMGLYFLMFVQEQPVIPCLHSLPNNNRCQYPLCLTRANKVVRDFNISYHNCFDIDLQAENELSGELLHVPQYGTIWTSQNKKCTSELLIEAFKWFSCADTIIKPKSIISKFPPIPQAEWENDILVFADVFNHIQNIGASCTVIGARAINKEFAKAHRMLIANSSFEEVLNL